MEAVKGKFLTTYRKAMPLEDGIKFRDEIYVVGEDDRHSLTIRTVNRLCEFAGLMVKEAQRRAGAKYVFSVAVTLPLETCIYEQQKKKKGLPSLIDAVEKSVKDAGFHFLGAYPQGILALERLVNKGAVTSDKPTLVVDGGFNTVNIMVLEGVKPLFFTSFYDRGVKQILSAFKRKLEEEGIAFSLSIPELQRAFLKKEIDLITKKRDLTKEIESVVESYVTSLYEDITDVLMERGVGFEKIVFVGGLSYYVKGAEKVFSKEVYIPEEGGEFLNVEGLYDRIEDEGENNWMAVDLGFGHVKYAVPKIAAIEKGEY